MREHHILTARSNQLNPKRSLSTVHVHLNLPLESGPHAAPVGRARGRRTGIVVAELIAKEQARREERERIRQAMGME